jgi:glyoxylate reductase
LRRRSGSGASIPKPKLVITRHLPPESLAIVAPHFQIFHWNKGNAIPRKLLLKQLKDADALLCLLTEKIDPELLAAAPNLKMVATISVGLDHVNVPACTKRGVPVTHTPGVLTETCADFAWALLLASARRVAEGDKYMRAGKYKAWDLLMMLGTDVHGKTLGIIGFGRIGQAVARRAAGFDMRVLYHDTLLPKPPDGIRAERVDSLDQLLSQSDFVSIHTVLDPSTRHLIGEKELRKMKPSAYLVNSARGPIVDEKALVKALKGGWIRGAGLDVYEEEPKMAPGLAKLPNVVLAPHLASASIETRTGMASMAASSLVDFVIKNTRPKNLANPDVFGSASPVLTA